MEIKKEELEGVSVSKSAYDNFVSAIKARETREKYERVLKLILCKICNEFFSGSVEERAEQLVKLAKENPDYVQSLMLILCKKLRERTEKPKTDSAYLNPATVPNYFKPMKKLFQINDVPFSWSKVEAVYPEMNNKNEGRGYLKEEIRTFLEHAGLMDRAIALVASSGGIREGGLATLKWKDITPIYKVGGKLVYETVNQLPTETEALDENLVCARVWVYSGTADVYPAYISFEGYLALMNWKTQYANEIGMKVDENYPIFKKDGDMPVELRPTAIRARVENVLWASGLRKPLERDKRRHIVPAVQGFRKFFETTCFDAVKGESLLGLYISMSYIVNHRGLTNLDSAYFIKREPELIDQYLQAVPALTISEDAIKNQRIKQQQDTISQLEESQARELLEVKSKLASLQGLVQKLLKEKD
ncbi:MAG: hypothetical protein KGI11_08505 [Thaumarchaeota archaeon]|nr:hypothetical protein [Nitrososphaerota archaeon]